MKVLFRFFFLNDVWRVGGGEEGVHVLRHVHHAVGHGGAGEQEGHQGGARGGQQGAGHGGGHGRVQSFTRPGHTKVFLIDK